MKNLAVYGAGGHGRVVADLAKILGWRDINFFAENKPNDKVEFSLPYVGNLNCLLDSLAKFDGVIVAIGNNTVRWGIYQQLKIANAPIIKLVHPSAIIGSSVKIGDGSVLVAGSIINVGVSIGESCIINTGATIDHDSVLGNAVQVCPGVNLAGSVVVGNKSWIGIGASVIQGINIGNDVIVGAGSVVIENIPDGIKVVGNPARAINIRNKLELNE